MAKIFLAQRSVGFGVMTSVFHHQKWRDIYLLGLNLKISLFNNNNNNNNNNKEEEEEGVRLLSNLLFKHGKIGNSMHPIPYATWLAKCLF